MVDASTNKRSKPTDEFWPFILTIPGIYLLWTGVTYLLEGRLNTLIRPEAITNRMVYGLLANILLGTVVPLGVLQKLIRKSDRKKDRMGFQPVGRTFIGIGLAAGIGITLVFLQGLHSHGPIVFINLYVQVINVSIAEVLVCWGLIYNSVEILAKQNGFDAATCRISAIFLTSLLFGFYHIAHSPPFNALLQILILMIVGVVTSIIYVSSRDLYTTVIFHTFLGVTGVTQSLEKAGLLLAYTRLKLSLLGIGIVSISTLIVTDRYLIRRGSP